MASNFNIPDVNSVVMMHIKCLSHLTSLYYQECVTSTVNGACLHSFLCNVSSTDSHDFNFLLRVQIGGRYLNILLSRFPNLTCCFFTNKQQQFVDSHPQNCIVLECVCMRLV